MHVPKLGNLTIIGDFPLNITKLKVKRHISHSSPNIIANGKCRTVTQAGLYHGLDRYEILNTNRISVVIPALPYFSTLSHNRHDLRKKLLNTK